MWKQLPVFPHWWWHTGRRCIQRSPKLVKTEWWTFNKIWRWSSFRWRRSQWPTKSCKTNAQTYLLMLAIAECNKINIINLNIYMQHEKGQKSPLKIGQNNQQNGLVVPGIFRFRHSSDDNDSNPQLLQMDHMTVCVMTSVVIKGRCYSKAEHPQCCGDKSQKSAKFRLWDKVPEASTLILETGEFPYKSTYDKPMVASVPKPSWSVHLLFWYNTSGETADTGPRYAKHILHYAYAMHTVVW